jgi:hypothetical protein
LSIDREEAVLIGKNYYPKNLIDSWRLQHTIEPFESDQNLQILFIEEKIAEEIQNFLEIELLLSEELSRLKYLNILMCWLLTLNVNKALAHSEKCINILIIQMYGNEVVAKNAETLTNAFVNFVNSIFIGNSITSIIQSIDEQKLIKY